MKMRIVLIAILLINLSAAAFSDAVSGVSNTFGIDNTKGSPLPLTSVGKSPYNNGTVLLRGQLHSHRIPDVSGVSISSSTLALLYTSQGYDFLAQTEHHYKNSYTEISPESVLGSWQGWAPNSTELTYGALTPWPGFDTHVLAIGTSQGTTALDLHYHTGNKVNDTIQRIRNVKNHSGLAYVAHPDTPPYGISVDDLVTVVKSAGPNGIGIWTPLTTGIGVNSQNTWDQLVYKLGKPVWGYVEDDYHPDSAWRLGRTWVAVPGSPGEWWGNIKEKLRNGNYYCYYTTKGKWPGGSTPPQMRVTVSNAGSQPVISVNFDCVVDSIEFYGYDWGFFKKLKPRISGSSDSYQATGREKFVRVMACYKYGGVTLWMTSQPIVINKSGNQSPYYAASASGTMRLMSTSPTLILNYVDADNKPLAPPAGYVGDVFDVTTADGQVPPDATLQLSYAEENIGPLGGTQYLAIYRYDETTQQWVKIGGTVDINAQTIESTITTLGEYCISADLPADTTAPEVFIDDPVCGGVVSADTTVKATVNDDLGAWRVKFYLNDHLLAEDADSSDGWSADFKIADFCAGEWTLKAVAEDLAGNQGTVEIPIYIASSTSRPTVSITSPTSNAVLSGTVTATGTCGDDVEVAAVILKMDDTIVGYGDITDGTWTCDIDTSPLAEGNRTLTATVEDNPGNEASASVPVIISNGATSTSPGNAKEQPDGASVRIGDCVVVAVPALTGDGYYVESTDRSSGIRVRTSKALDLGDKINLVGTVNATSAEKAIEASDVSVVSSNNVIKPIGLTARALAQLPDSVGKIVKVWGNTGTIDSSTPAKWFMLNDASGVDLKCMLGNDVTVPSGGFVTVTGVCSVDSLTGQAIILVALSTDIQAIP